MKPILICCLLVLFLGNCKQKETEVLPNRYIKPLWLTVEPRPDGIALQWQPMFYFEEGMYPGPTPVSPTQYEIYLSENNKNGFQKVATTDGTVKSYVLLNQPPGKTLYAQVKAIHPTLAGSESTIVTTNTGTLGATDLLFPINTPAVTFGAWGGSSLIQASWDSTWVVWRADGTVQNIKKAGRNPLLSPNGRFIAYVSTIDNNTSYTTQLFIKNVNTGETRLLDTKRALFAVEWSNDSQSLAYLAATPTANISLWIRKLTDNESFYIPETNASPYWDERIDWSPDDKSVTVARQLSLNGRIGSEFLNISTDGASTQSLFSSEWQDRQPAYSPDGTQLAFISNRSGYPAVWLLSTQTGKLRQLTGTSEQFYYINRLDWKSNKELTYTAHMVPVTTIDTSLRVVTIPD